LLDYYSPQVAIDADGRAVFAWTFYDGAISLRGKYRIQARARAAAGALSPVQNISLSGTHGDGGGGARAQVAVDPTGDAVFSWVYTEAYTYPQEVQARARSAAGALSPIQNLTRRAGDADGLSPQVDVDNAGKAVITWWRHAYDQDSETYPTVAAQERSSAGVLGPLHAFSSTGSYPGPHPQVAVDGTGDAVLTWQDSDGTNTVIRAAAGP
jgi:hypothetical protein